MVKANELRIGNWVDFGYKHKREFNRRACQVISISEDNIVVLDKGVSLEADFYPIPLTPEILDKCGFEKRTGGLEEYYVLRFIELWKVGGDHSLYQLCIGKMIPTTVEYLHQLQNLYWCITGEEINIKL